MLRVELIMLTEAIVAYTEIQNGVMDGLMSLAELK